MKNAELLSSPEGLHGANSGKFPNQGKLYYFKLAAQVVRDVKIMREKDGLSYLGKVMIRCGLYLDVKVLG